MNYHIRSGLVFFAQIATHRCIENRARIKIMNSSELPKLQEAWNKSDENGAIEPPLSIAEVEALTNHNIYPDTAVRYSRYEEMARLAFISCKHFRFENNPQLTAQTVAAFI